jgi:hypothetical protein
LAGTKSDVLDDAVALVENADNSNTLGHRRHGLKRSIAAGFLGNRHCSVLLRLLLRTPPTAGERKRDDERCADPRHAYSGIQGS